MRHARTGIDLHRITFWGAFGVAVVLGFTSYARGRKPWLSPLEPDNWRRTYCTLRRELGFSEPKGPTYVPPPIVSQATPSPR